MSEDGIDITGTRPPTVQLRTPLDLEDGLLGTPPSLAATDDRSEDTEAWLVEVLSAERQHHNNGQTSSSFGAATAMGGGFR